MAVGGMATATDEIWKRTRAVVADAYAAITDDVFTACNDPNFDGETPFGPSQHVYGECVDTEGICAMMGVTQSDVLCDLGSGRGQIVLEAALQGISGRAVGVELVPARAALARAALERLLRTTDHVAAGLLRSRAVLVEGDMFVQREALDAFRDATCVFCANTAFAPGLNDLLAKLLGDRFSVGGEDASVRADGVGRQPTTTTSSSSSSSSSPRMPRLRVAALTARLSTEAEIAARLRLVRVGALAVSWHSAGTPVFIYHPASSSDEDEDDNHHDQHDGTGPRATTGDDGDGDGGGSGAGAGGGGVGGAGPDGAGGSEETTKKQKQKHVVDPEAEAMIEDMRAACAGLSGNNAQFRALMRVSVFHSMIHDDVWQKPAV